MCVAGRCTDFVFLFIFKRKVKGKLTQNKTFKFAIPGMLSLALSTRHGTKDGRMCHCMLVTHDD